MISAMEQRVRHYWTLRSHDFGAVRKNELENEMGQKWLREIERLLPEKEHLRHRNRLFCGAAGTDRASGRGH